MDSTTRDRSRARIEIVFGYGVAATGGLIGLISWLAEGNIRYSSNADVQAFATAFAFVASFAVWWYLSQLVVDSASHRLLVRRALTALVVEDLLLAIASLAFVIEFRDLNFSWSLAGDALVGLGALLSAIGFYSLRLTFRDGLDTPQPADAHVTD
jgi:hypothetical protein